MENKEYTIAELFERLIADESWEADPDVRLSVAKSMFAVLNRNIVQLRR
jgi:hypothetical protein